MNVALLHAEQRAREVRTGPGEELVFASPPLAPHQTFAPRHSADVVRHVITSEAAVRRVNDITVRPVPHRYDPVDPVRESDFDPQRTRRPSNAYTLNPSFPDGGTFEDRFVRARFDQTKVVFVAGVDFPQGRWYDWAALRRNLVRTHPESYGEQVELQGPEYA